MKRKIIIAILSAIAASALCGFVFAGCAKNAHMNDEQPTADLPTVEQGIENVLPPHEDTAIESSCTHEYSAWTVGYAPTCTSIGYDVRTCEKCGNTDYRFFDAKGHTPIQVNYNQSIHIYECETCGELVTAEHDFDENETCTFCKYVADYTLGLRFYLTDDNQSYSVCCANSNFENLIIPSTYKGLPVTEIYERGFNNCTNLKSVVIPDSVTKIERQAFYRCSNLTDVIFPKFLKEIGDLIFQNCTALKDITLPKNLTVVGGGIFYGCTALTEVNVPKDWTEIPRNMYMGCTGLENIEIPEQITSIGQAAFANCTSLKSVKFGNNVTYIGKSAFIRCSALENVVMPESLIEIDSQAFFDCASLKSVKLNENLTTLGLATFAYCSALENVEFGNNVTYIGSQMFWFCTALESIELPASLLEIGSSAFSGTAIKKIVLKEGAKVLGGFGGCGTLVEVVLPESLTLICRGALPNYDGLTRITYNGTMAQWKAIEKESGWKSSDNIITNFFVDCTDGTLEYIW